MSRKEKIAAIQTVLGVQADSMWGPISQGTFDLLIHGIESDDRVHVCIASSFADPSDIAAFRACRAKGRSEKVCFKYGDNGIGYWGDDTTKGSGPSCALTPEDMVETFGSITNAHLKTVVVQANGNSVRAKVKDTMMHRSQITNGTGIDLNPDACDALGLVPPVLARATWEAVNDV